MSKSVVSESNEGHEHLKMGGKRGEGDEGGENGVGFVEVPPAESLSISTTVSTAPPSWITKLRKPELRAELSDRSVKFEKKDNKTVLIELLRLRLLYENRVLGGNNFLNTDDFCRLLVPFLPNDTLMMIRLVSKPWSHVADGLIDEGVRKGEFIVHDGKDINYEVGLAREERRALVTQVIFLLNITKVGDCACLRARYLVVVDIPDLTTVSFPKTLTNIGRSTFNICTGLEKVDLLHTNLQESEMYAFANCSELKSMTIPDSLQTLGPNVFWNCSKLVPASITVSYNSDVPPVVAHLPLKQNQTQQKRDSNFIPNKLS